MNSTLLYIIVYLLGFIFGAFALLIGFAVLIHIGLKQDKEKEDE